MQTSSCRRPAALALILATLTLAVAGCERRTNDPTLPTTSGTTSGTGSGANNQGTVIPTPPATTPSTTSPNTLPDTPASAASR